MQRVVAGSAVKRIVARPSLNRVVAGQCVDDIVAGGPGEGVVAGGEAHVCQVNGRACQAVRVAAAVRVADLRADVEAAHGFVGGEGSAGGAGDVCPAVDAVAALLPLVSVDDVAGNAVGVGQRARAGGQGGDIRDAVVGRPGNGDGAGRQVVDVGDLRRPQAALDFELAEAVHVGSGHADVLADLSLAQRQGVVDRSGDGHAIGQPLIADRAHAVHIGQPVAGRQRLALGRRAGYANRAGGLGVDMLNRGGGGAGNAFGVAEAVGVTRHHGDGFVYLRRARDEGGVGGAADVHAVGLPLIADRSQAVEVGQGVARGQRLVLGCRAGYGNASGRRVVDIGHRCGGCAGDTLMRAEAVGVARHHADGLVHLRLAEYEGGAGADCRGAVHPGVGDGAQAVQIGQGVGRGQRLALGRRAADGYAAGRCVVHVRHRGGCGGGDALVGAQLVGVARHHADGFIHLRLAERKGRTGAKGGRSVHPGVGDGAQAVQVGQGVGRGQRLALGRRAGYGYRAGRRVVHVCHRCGSGAGDALAVAEAVGVACHHGEGLADLSLAEHEAGAGAKGGRAVHPGVGDGTQAVGVGQVVACRQGLVLRGRTADGHAADGRVVHVRHRAGGRAGNALVRPLLVGVARHDADGFAHLILAEHEARASADGCYAVIPRVGDRPQAVDVGQGVGCGQGLALGRRAVYGYAAGGRVVHVDHRGGGGAGDAFGMAEAVVVAGHHRDDFAHLALAQRKCVSDEGVLPVDIPVIGDGTQTVYVCKGVAGSQRRALYRRAGDGHAAGGRVVHVGHRGGGGAGDALRRALLIRVARHHGDGLGHLLLAEREGGAGADGSGSVHPGVGDGAQAVDVRQGVTGGQRLVLLRRAADRHAAGGRVVHVRHSDGCGAGDALCMTEAVRVARHEADGFAYLSLAQYVA